MLTDGRTDGRRDDGQKVITIAHPEHSSGELKRSQKKFQHYGFLLHKIRQASEGVYKI